MRRFFSGIVLLAVALLSLTSCHYKDLYEDDLADEKAVLKVPVDWSDFDKYKPSGMTVMAFPTDDQEPTTALSNDLEFAELGLPVGDYHILVFNQSTDEFGSFHFEGMDSYSTACVRANDTRSSWYKGRATDEPTIDAPEWLAAGQLEPVRVTDEMVDASDSVFVTDTVYPRDVIYTIYVHIHVKGIYNIRSARASLDGMADGYRFATGKPTTTRTTQLLEHWTLTRDKDNPSEGELSAKIQSFGLPDGHQNHPTENELRLSLLLVDDKTQKDFTFDVGDKFRRGDGENSDTIQVSKEDMDLSLDMSIETALPDVKPTEGSSGGFDATVEDWGDDIDINVGM